MSIDIFFFCSRGLCHSPLAPISTKAIDTDQLSRLPSFDLGSINSTLPAHHNPGIQAKQPTNSLATLPSLPGLPGLSPPHASTYTSAAPAHTLPTYDDTAAMPMDTDMSSDLPGVSDPVAPVSEPVVAEAAVEIDEEKVAACEKELSTLTEKRVSLLQGVQTQINPMLKKRFQSQLTACEKSLEEVQARLDRLKRGED
ncbi:hypothetical protein SARC_06012 [Sphaeroforma arctica JP610]|uniref:Uncharacterized protein n=1 Tax=Sphaeroforma arctica JP610 TaxID=667725 RepID=A0A0L0FXY6_9EUKA|nr:hypothetical protein SARC_06012 [Sphaeroforma arctica JP610]KNC81682.1 hypothetical protein SARC_06012 [Sphaeroforma arctica JP610]|eukprot:XP_014155584.1 hypothetical protein SARC_06012 [Sphaeroforma arctica JP610]